MKEEQREITELLNRIHEGDQDAADRLAILLNQTLRKLAQQMMMRERPGHTLQATALVNEAYLRMVDQKQEWKSRSHFIGVAAHQMRRILIDYSRQHAAAKRGSGKKVSLDEAPPLFSEERAEEMIAVDEALERLRQFDERLSNVVELKYFGGLTATEIAQVVGISTDSVHKEWAAAKGWLYAHMNK